MAAFKPEEISLDVYGPIEEEPYWDTCKEIIEKHQLTVNHKGALYPDQITEHLQQYHFFILPTQHENFGHVVVEALVSGCGVILSDQTPWRELESKGIGWDIPLADRTKWHQTLKECIEMTNTQYAELRNACYKFVENTIDDEQNIKDTALLFS